MDTVAVNTNFLEMEMIALAKAAGEWKRCILRCFKCKDISRDTKNKEYIGERLEELLFMQVELGQYIQKLEEVQGLYENLNEEWISMVLSSNEMEEGR